MILHRRPPRPAGFPGGDITRAEARLREQASAKDTPELWGAWKPAFSEAQHHRCAWCDVEQTGSTCAVDHIAPKGAVESLGDPGVELPDVNNFRGRQFNPIHATGYWWRTYDWDNWVYACERCNSWKRALYPVAEEPHPAPSQDSTFTPLVLCPFGPEDPEDHLDFDDTGQILPLSRRGGATIDVCGLDRRESLRRLRERVVRRVRDLCLDLVDHPDDPSMVEKLVREVERSANLASVARAVVRREIGCRWTELDP